MLQGSEDLIPMAWSGEREQAFPAPWFDYASTQMPISMIDALRWCEFIVSTQPVYRSAIERVVSYFITEIDVSGTDDAGKKKYKELLENTLGIYSHLKAIGIDFLTYGNSFISIIEPMRKYFSCGNENCGFEAPATVVLENNEFRAQWRNGVVSAQCPNCNRRTNWHSITRKNLSGDNIQIKRWPPYEILIEWCPVTDKTRIIWRVPGYFRRQVMRGDPFVISNVPDELLQAALHNQDVRFYPSEILHLKEPCLAGHYVRGWGVSRVLTHFRQAWLLAVYHRHNEAIAMDYIMPLRIISPETKGSVIGDPLLMGDMGKLSSDLEFMIHARRSDPTRWAIFPFPVRYQFVGGEGSQMAPVNLIEHTRNDMLEAIGIPVELYRANLSLNSAPIAVRLFETCWSHLVFMFNRFLQWTVDRIAKLYGWDPVSVKLIRPSISDDINRQMARLQLMLSGIVSRSTALKPMGVDFEEEVRRRMDEERILAEQTAEAQKEIEQESAMQQLLANVVGMGDMSQMAAGMPGGAMPAGAPGGAPPPVPPSPEAAAVAQMGVSGSQFSPADIEGMATTLAQQIYTQPLGQRISSLRKLRMQSPVVHAVVKEKIRQMDAAGEQQGREAMRTSAAQGGMMPR